MKNKEIKEAVNETTESQLDITPTLPAAKPSDRKDFFSKIKNAIFPSKGAVDYKVDKISIAKSFVVYKGMWKQLPWVFIILSLVAAIVNAALSLTIVQFSANVIDTAGNVPTKQLTEYIISGIIVGVCMIAATTLQAYFTAKINHQMRSKLWDKILKLRQCEMGVNGGEQLVSRVTSDCESSAGYFTSFINIITKTVQLVVYIVGMFNSNTTMSLFAMIFIPLSVALCWLLSWLKYRVTLKRQGFLAMSTTYLVERTKDLALIKTCNAQQKEIERGNQYFDAQYANQIKIGWVSFLANSTNKLLEMLSTILPFCVGAVLYAKGEITIGRIVMFNTLITETKNILQNLITYVSSLKETNGALARIAKVFTYGEEPLNEGIAAPDEIRDIVFDNVTFAYADKNILKNVSLTIPRNKVTAILGHNGSGKTTSFRLIERLYDPNSGGGAVRFGDDDIHDYTLSSWRNKICVVAQGGELMSGTLSSNICYGRNDVTRAEYENALSLSHVADFVGELPVGIDPPVLPDGTNFSGGQRQCIALARAMLSKKPYLLLDEATCNLDAKREADIMDALDNLVKDRTTVIIAHSLGTVKHADYVIVLKDGEVESTGTPNDILKQTDNYLVKMMNRANA